MYCSFSKNELSTEYCSAHRYLEGSTVSLRYLFQVEDMACCSIALKRQSSSGTSILNSVSKLEKKENMLVLATQRVNYIIDS